MAKFCRLTGEAEPHDPMKGFFLLNSQGCQDDACRFDQLYQQDMRSTLRTA
jgi:hypothetical protein